MNTEALATISALSTVANLTLTLGSLYMFSLNLKDRRERKDRERAAANEIIERRRWCEEMREKLDLFGSGKSMGIKPEKFDWARWGAEEGFFALASSDPMRPAIRRK